MWKTASKLISLNRWKNFYNISFMQNAVWTIDEQFYSVILQGGGKLQKSPVFFLIYTLSVREKMWQGKKRNNFLSKNVSKYSKFS